MSGSAIPTNTTYYGSKLNCSSEKWKSLSQFECREAQTLLGTKLSELRSIWVSRALHTVPPVAVLFGSAAIREWPVLGSLSAGWQAIRCHPSLVRTALYQSEKHSTRSLRPKSWSKYKYNAANDMDCGKNKWGCIMICLQRICVCVCVWWVEGLGVVKELKHIHIK